MKILKVLNNYWWFITLALLALSQPSAVRAQDSVFTYQGRVTDNGINFNGTGQFKFALLTPTNINQQATAFVTGIAGTFLFNYSVTTISLESGGSGYVTPPTVTIAPGSDPDNPATATATISNGVVTALNLTSGGDGYETYPAITIAPPPPDFVNATLWSNDGTTNGEPAAAVNVPVNNGLFTIVLGDTNQPDMEAIPSSLFTQPNLLLQIWFNDGEHGFAALNPVQPLTPAPYAIVAGSASNLLGTLPASQLSGTIPTSQLSGTLPGGELPADVALLDADQSFTGATAILHNMGINTNNPQQSLSVVGGVNIDQASQNIGSVNNALTFGSGAGEGIGSDRGGVHADSFGLNFYTDFGKRLTILQHGNVGIGTTNADMLLTVDGGADKPGGGSWSTFSDGRLKDVGANFTEGLEALADIQPVHYHYKVDNALNLPPQPEYVGVVAQQVQSAIPEAVQRNKDGYLVVNNDPIIWTMFNAIKELKTENEALKQRLDRLEKEKAGSNPNTGQNGSGQ